MNYCSQCGATIERRVPPGDDRPRFYCRVCGTIHYQNPKLVVGCIAEWGAKILLCRRAIGPRQGKWTLPAGYLENGETVSEGAIREVLEEACAKVQIIQLYALYSIPFINQIYLMFRARLIDQNYRPGSESLEVRLLSEDEIPWDQLAFRVIEKTLERYFSDRLRGVYHFHMDNIQHQKLGSTL
ncbi:MAG: NUDIX hydrolase [Deltaproteobacteria bacterium]|nr:MAG: NUDIX hydrolase [Deltaproteobacteria bacterium]